MWVAARLGCALRARGAFDRVAAPLEGTDDDPAATRPVDMTAEEAMMSNDVEELSEDMKRESDIESRKAMGKTSLAFIDLENMNNGTQLAFICLAAAFFSAIAWYFYTNLFNKSVEMTHREKV